MKIAVFGGSFNPVHIGHLIAASYAINNGGMDKVLFIPSGNHPFIEKRKTISSDIRLEMLKNAIKNDDMFDFSTIEIDSKEISYTYDTFLKLKEIYPDDELFFIIGYDILFDLPKWNKIEELSKICSFLVMNRDTDRNKELKNIVDELTDKYNIKLNFVDSPIIGISSSDIRKHIAENKRVNYLVPDTVLEIIKREGLYGYGL